MSGRTVRRRKRSFIERSIGEFLGAFERSQVAEQEAARRGILQALDPRVKVVGLFSLILASALASSVAAVAAVFLVGLLLAVFSRVSLLTLAKRAWLPALLFSGPVALPALVTTPGDAIVRFPEVGLELTWQGVRTVTLLLTRVETAATLTLLLILTTAWPHVLKSLHSLGVPGIVVAILGMTYRYLFALLQSAVDMFEARRSRTVGVLDPANRRRLAASAGGVLFSKSIRMSDEIYLAMRSRGFRGEVHILDDFQTKKRDWVALVVFLALAVAVVVAGRVA
jgi:cobalt/nickel transport system permease protein